ncbi:uncharacterized protein FPRO_07551 [Fusarium proliferatum ET1]|uniref:Uncharacterized protein n=1 Tax=Fusarium proliferatum (strain ET1) TaxID=1227346 RepID=A0A1L7VSX7_FUSPR|nr:uncharacterized protein FPRO_07551 [Fusarium proliferatum ET1]CZR43532.1 uncharacterized protein FPRO_07551 [Fusarium proliferatum ET1]
MRKPSVQQPWKAHVPTVSEIEGPVAVGLIDVEVVLVVLVVVEEALEVVELLVVEVLELVVVVELARNVVLEVADVDDVDELVVEDVVEEGTPEVERDVAVAELTLDMLETPAGPPTTKELNEETAEAPDDMVRDEERLTMEDVVTEDSALKEALKTLEGNVFDDTTLESTELEIDEVVLAVVVVETRELVEESVAKVVHVVEEVLELTLEVVVDEVEAVDLEEELVLLLLAVEEALVAAPLVEELKTELLEPPETERLAEEDALLRPPAKLPNTLREVLKELVELVDILLETGTEIELLTEPVLVEAPFEVELDTLLEDELPLVEVKEDGREALEELDVAPMLVDATEPELDTERAALEEVAIEEPTLLADEKAPIDVGNELL